MRAPAGRRMRAMAPDSSARPLPLAVPRRAAHRVRVGGGRSSRHWGRTIARGASVGSRRCVQTVARRQVEIMRDSMKEAGDAVSAINAAKTVEEKVAKQAEATKAAYLKGVADMRELSELGAKSSQEAFEVLNARVSEGLDEFGKQVNKVA